MIQRKTTPRFFPSLTLCAALALGACGNASQNETGTPLVNDEERYPGNDNGMNPSEDLLAEGEANTIGTVGSYEAEEGSDGVYDATVGMEDDNPNRSAAARGEGNDPVTPNGPLADGTVGQPDAAQLRTAESARNREVEAGAYRNTYESGDSPYGNNMEPRTARGMGEADTSGLLGLKAYVRADGGTNMPVYVPGGDPGAFVDEFYGGDGRTSPTEQPEGDFYQVSTFRPAMSDVTAATYANTLTKLVNKPGAQSYRVYQPIQLKITPLLSWRAPANGASDPDVLPTLGGDCAEAEDGVGCSSGTFQDAIAPIVNDQRVARAISSGMVDGFTFELDDRGRVDINSLAVKTGAADCVNADCSRLRDVLAGAIAAQDWSAARVDGRPTAARVEVPFRYDVERLGSKVNTP